MANFATITLGGHGLAVLRDKVADLNRRAVKSGLAEIQLHVVEEFGFVKITRTFQARVLFPSVIKYVVEVSGEEPRINGWRMLAKIEFTAEFGSIIKTLPGIDSIDSRFREVGPVCEHCNSQRRRNDVFVLEHEDGTTKVVGRNCLADFIRTGDAETLAAYAAFAEQVKDFIGDASDPDFEDSGWGRTEYTPTLIEYLTIVSVLIRREGWTSRTVAKDSFDKLATADDARFFFTAKRQDRDEWIKKKELYPNAKDAELVEKSLEWGKTVDSSRSEYLDTVRKIATAGVFSWKYDGYTASILAAYLRAQDEEIKRKETKKCAPRVYRGSRQAHEEAGRDGCTDALHGRDVWGQDDCNARSAGGRRAGRDDLVCQR